MNISPERLAKSILNEKKYLLTYHKNRDFLHSFVLPAILEVEQSLKMLPPLKMSKEEFLYYEKSFCSLTRRIAGYSYYIAKQTIKEGFPMGDYFQIYLEKERQEIALFLFQEQESIFRQTINDTLLELIGLSNQNFYQYFRNYLLYPFFSIYIQLFKEVFLFVMTKEPVTKRQEVIPTH
ncbi:hypothetical protein [Tepidibacillus sp. LV47]|uniref:hypothetical protein n=1 Tax=Tepidibacillus sp. LV47 TaxID=3398228 RepID=UPI003AACFABA